MPSPNPDCSEPASTATTSPSRVRGRQAPPGIFPDWRPRTTAPGRSWSEAISRVMTSIETEDVDEHGHQGFVGAEARYAAPKEISSPSVGARRSRSDSHFAARAFPGHGTGSSFARRPLCTGGSRARRSTFGVEQSQPDPRLLSLAVGRPVSITSLAGFTPEEDGGSAEPRRPIQLLWQIPHNPDPPEKARERGRCCSRP